MLKSKNDLYQEIETTIRLMEEACKVAEINQNLQTILFKQKTQYESLMKNIDNFEDKGHFKFKVKTDNLYCENCLQEFRNRMIFDSQQTIHTYANSQGMISNDQKNVSNQLRGLFATASEAA